MEAALLVAWEENKSNVIAVEETINKEDASVL